MEDSTNVDEPNEFEGFMLTAREANQEMQAHSNYWKSQGKEPKFSLCIYVDKGAREQKWKLPHSKEKWRKRWRDWTKGDVQIFGVAKSKR